MSTTQSANMGLIIPGVGSESGPDYATDINSSLTIIDQHDHTPGSGVLITPSAININAALTLANNFLTNAAGVTLYPQGSTPAVNTLYESGTDLYFVDGLGNNVRITQSGGVAGSPGSISNLSSPASAAYVSGSQTFFWKSGASASANMDFGAAIMRNLSPNSTFALTLQPPAALGSNYTITLPTLPAATAFLTINTSGTISASPALLGALTTANLSASAAILGTQLSASANILGSQLSSSAGIVGGQLANATVTASKIATATITSTQISDTAGILHNQIVATKASLGSSSSSFSRGTAGFGTVTNLSSPFSCTLGKLYKLELVSDNSGSAAGLAASSTDGGLLRFLADGTEIGRYYIAPWQVAPTTTNAPSSTYSMHYSALTTASVTFSVQIAPSNGNTVYCTNTKLLVYEVC